MTSSLICMELRIRLLLPLLTLFQAWPVQVRCQDQVQLVHGDVMLAAMFGVNALEGEGCGAYDVNVLKRVMAVTWFLDTLNDMDYFGRGIKLGLTVYRTCQNQGRATSQAVNILNQFSVLTPQLVQTVNATPPLLGLLGPDRTEEAIAVSRFYSSLPPARRPLQISASATGEALANRALYSNFFRVIPPDSIQVDALLKLLKALHWNYIAIIYDDHDYGRLASDRLRRLAESSNICVTYHSQVPLDSRRLEFAVKVNAITDVIRHRLIKGLVFIGNRATAKEFLIKLQNRVLFPRFIFSEAVGLQDSVFRHVGSVLALSKGAFVVSPPSRPLPRFRDHWNEVWTNRTLFLEAAQQNPWLAGYFSDLARDCTAADDLCWASTQSRRPLLDDNTRWLFEFYSVKAVAVFAALLKKMVTNYCQGEPGIGVCLNLKTVMVNSRQTVQNLVERSSFDFEEEFVSITSASLNVTSARFNEAGEIVERVDGSVYDVYNFQRCHNEQFCFKKVGGLTSQSELQLDLSAVRGYSENGAELTSPSLPKAQCSANTVCSECLPSGIADEIIVVPGDVYFVAVAPVYDRDREDVLGCGSIRTSAGADLAQSVLFALDQVNAPEGGVFRGSKKLGVVIINSCYRELVIKRKLMEFFGGKLMLPDGSNSSAILPYVAGYVGAFFSSVSIAMYEMLSKVTSRFVMLSPANTSPNLSDRDKYPLYLRLTTKSDAQARAILDIVAKLNASYAQVVYDPEDDYSNGLKEAITQLSHTRPFNICVIQNVNTSYDDNSLGKVRDKLLQYSWVSVVIVVLQYEHARNFTNIVTTTIKPGQFIFIGSEAWERRQEMIEPFEAKEKKLEGSYVLYQGLPVDRQFDDYFRKLNPFTSINPWLRYFWEAAENCYFQDSFEKKGRKPCPLAPSGGLMRPLTQGYVQSVWLPFYINAVKVFAEGLHSAMMDQCQTERLCEELTPEDLIRHLKGVRMDLMGTRQHQPVFDHNGDGLAGYDVYQVQRQLGKLTYVKVGSYLNGVGTLVVSPPYPPSGHCLTQEQCHRCFPPPPTRHQCRPSANREAAEPDRTPFIVVLVLLLLFLLVCSIVIVAYLCRRRRTLLSKCSQPSSSMRRLQSLDPSELSPGPESEAGFRRLHSTPSSSCSLCTCGGASAAAAAAAAPARRARDEPAYEDILHSFPNVRVRPENAVAWKSCKSAPPPQPPVQAEVSRDVAAFHGEYVPRGEEDYADVSAKPAPGIVFANELSAGSSAGDGSGGLPLP